MMIIVLILTILCAVLAIRATRILIAILWLALVSALTGLLFYMAGAWLIAVIELSVGTGLATVLMVFVITMIGDEHEVVPLKPLRLSLVIVTVVLVCVLTVPFIPDPTLIRQDAIDTVLWQARGLDIFPQVALIFSGMIGVLALMSEAKNIAIVSRDNAQQTTSPELMSYDRQSPVEQEAAR